MNIILSPQRRDDALSVVKSGDVLTINGEAFDFSALPEGGELPSDAVNSRFIHGPVRRVGGEISLTVILPHGPNPPPAVAFPSHLLSVPDGPISLPAEEIIE